MANGSQPLFRIDPTDGFIEYVNTVKPYHSKILDVLVEYIHSESATATVTENWSWIYEFRRPDVDILYSCGYGYRWDPTGSSAPETVPSATIVHAYDQNDATYANTFVIDPPVLNPYNCVVTDLKSNQLAFTRGFDISGLSASGQYFVVDEDVTLYDHFTVDDYVYVTDNDGAGINGRYRVTNITVNSGISTIEVNEPVSLLGTASGKLNFVLPFDEVPYWPSGTTVTLDATILPAPIGASDYHFIPCATPGYFNLATERYPQRYEEIVDLTRVGTGDIQITRTEPFVPGDPVIVYGSAGSRNDGSYIVGTVTEVDGAFYVQVMQRISKSTTIGITTDGNLFLDVSNWSAPAFCALARAPDIHAEAFIHEDLRFSFEMVFRDDIRPVVADAGSPQVLVTSNSLIPHGFDVQIYDLGGFDG